MRRQDAERNVERELTGPQRGQVNRSINERIARPASGNRIAIGPGQIGLHEDGDSLYIIAARKDGRVFRIALTEV